MHRARVTESDGVVTVEPIQPVKPPEGWGGWWRLMRAVELSMYAPDRTRGFDHAVRNILHDYMDFAAWKKLIMSDEELESCQDGDHTPESGMRFCYSYINPDQGLQIMIIRSTDGFLRVRIRGHMQLSGGTFDSGWWPTDRRQHLLEQYDLSLEYLIEMPSQG